MRVNGKGSEPKKKREEKAEDKEQVKIEKATKKNVKSASKNAQPQKLEPQKAKEVKKVVRSSVSPSSDKVNEAVSTKPSTAKKVDLLPSKKTNQLDQAKGSKTIIQFRQKVPRQHLSQNEDRNNEMSSKASQRSCSQQKDKKIDKTPQKNQRSILSFLKKN